MFFKNILKLLSGSSVAQVLPFLALPVLTREMGSEAFGEYSIFFTTTMMLGALSSFRLDYAINSARSMYEAKIICILCLVSSIFTTSILIVVVFTLYYSKVISSVWLILPISVLAMSINLCLVCLANYLSLFKEMTYSRVLNAVICVVIQFFFVSILNNNNGAYWGLALGFIISSIYLLIVLPNFQFKVTSLTRAKLHIVFFRYITYPKFIFPGSFINFATGNAPIYFVGFFFGTAQAGYYSLAFRIAGAPVTILARSISEVYRAKASKCFVDNGNFEEVFKKTSVFSMLIAVVGFSLLAFLVEDIFNIVFGDGWNDAAIYTVLLIPAFILQFSTTAIGYSLMIVKWQKYDFLWQLFRLFLTSISILIVILFDFSEVYFIICTSIALTAGYLAYFYLCYRSSFGQSNIF